jgi:HNH endonuclease
MRVNPRTVYASPAERLREGLVRQANGCLEWTKYTRSGYGQIEAYGKTWDTHRLAWTLEHGSIPPGVHVLHHCDNPPCCDAIDTEHHLFLGTPADNAADRDAKGRHATNGMEQRTHCKNDHPYNEANLTTGPDGSRGCKACNRDKQARYMARRRAL